MSLVDTGEPKGAQQRGSLLSPPLVPWCTCSISADKVELLTICVVFVSSPGGPAGSPSAGRCGPEHHPVWLCWCAAASLQLVWQARVCPECL